MTTITDHATTIQQLVTTIGHKDHKTDNDNDHNWPQGDLLRAAVCIQYVFIRILTALTSLFLM